MASLTLSGLRRGPLELKNTKGKTPVLDLGALTKIRSGDIKVVPGVKRFNSGEVELVNGEKLYVDVVVLATGYYSNGDFFGMLQNSLAMTLQAVQATTNAQPAIARHSFKVRTVQSKS
ncbi:hypothetical protein VIGAN_02189800 [Vigna angularis var. angularis]|uniref:indole-3-pyruvate monooxygenase n=1 Tax=Vigna angularis var. angularis TaxID=157739 RepID=A0A0S3RF03_PHAAN|nr:hypothetical protein VIGAN_02189800 [Vigna angularis var. angularis]